MARDPTITGSDTRYLEARGVGVASAGRQILVDVNLRVVAGEIATVQGASGSGKTTLLRALATLTAVGRGTIELDGKDARELSPCSYRRRVAYVLQQPPMLEGSVADNVAKGPRLAGTEPSPAELAALLDRVGLSPEFLPREARTLSGGERQRVALARALANRPEFLLLDEPTSALDPTAATKVLDLVRILGRQGLGVVLVTHVEHDAEAIADARYQCIDGRLAPRSAP